MQGEELNQSATSQSDIASEPNGAGKPSEPVVPASMTDSQSSDYYNKTQQLAQERRDFEAERQAWQQRSTQQYQPQQYQQPQNYPSQQAQPNPNDPSVFNGLVKELGYEAAKSIVESFNQFTQPVQHQLAATQQMIQQTEARALIGEIKSRGREQFGSEWQKNEKAVLEKIINHGIPLNDAWTIVTAPNLRQAAMDEAYRNQGQKTAANVAAPNVAPSNAVPASSSFNDAFETAWNQHAG